MKRKLLIGLFLLTLQGFSQSNETIEWINNNSILIEDSDPDTELSSFHKQAPEKFVNARIYGFGELSHDGKEYFNLKAKYFKYLVVNHNVTTFMIEDSFKAEESINLWINNKSDDFNIVYHAFTTGFWYSTEIYDLLNWIREYNLTHEKNQRIKFYTFDTQSSQNLDKYTLELIDAYEIPVEKSLVENFKACQKKEITMTATPNWADSKVPQLELLKTKINDFFESTHMDSIPQLKEVNREINVLINYTEFVQNPTNAVRDLQMYENAQWILENEIPNEKAFIWAHNEHINKRGMFSYNSGIKNLGSFLKDTYKDGYYSVGFDFGIGKLKGNDPKHKLNNGWRIYNIEKPYKKTYSETLFKAEKDIFFLDMSRAKTTEPNSFFSSANQTLSIGGGGFKPKPLYRIKMSKVYTDDYDALIFIKEISPADNLIKIE